MDDDARQRRVDHFNAGAAGHADETSYHVSQRERVRQVHGSKDTGALFGPHGVTTTTPWPGAARYKDAPVFDREQVHAELRHPDRRLVNIDPRILSANQPGLVRAGVAHYYDHPDYADLGHTFADHHEVGNQFPFVVTKRTRSPNQPPHEHVIIAGHHRAAAALLRGTHLRARWIEQE